MQYETSSGLSGRTTEKCEYRYNKGDTIKFLIGGQTIGVVRADKYVFVDEMSSYEQVAMIMQSLDSDGLPDNGIQIKTTDDEALKKLSYSIYEVDPNDQNFRSQFKTLVGKEFNANETGSIQHSIDAPKAELLKNSGIYDYYHGNSPLAGCLTDFPCNRDILEGDAPMSAWYRLNHYFWHFHVEPLMNLQHRAMVWESLNVLERKKEAEKSAKFIADAFAAISSLNANPNGTKYLLKNIENKAEGELSSMTEDKIKEYFIGKDELWAAGAVDGFLKGSRVYEECLLERDISKFSALDCVSQFSQEVYQVYLNGIAAWMLYSKQDEIDTYSAALDYLNARYNAAGKLAFVTQQAEYGHPATWSELKQHFINNRNVDKVLFDKIVNDAIEMVNRNVQDLQAKAIILSPAQQNSSTAMMDIRIKKVSTIKDFIVVCVEFENLSNDGLIIDEGQIQFRSLGENGVFNNSIYYGISQGIGGSKFNLYNYGDTYNGCLAVKMDNPNVTNDFLGISTWVQYKKYKNDPLGIIHTSSLNNTYEYGSTFDQEILQKELSLSLVKKFQTAEPGEQILLKLDDGDLNFDSEPYTPPSGTEYDWRITSPEGVSILNNGTTASFIAPEIPIGANHVFIRGRVNVTTPSGESEKELFFVNVVSKKIVTPQPPKNLALTSNDSAVVYLSWDASPFANGYKVYISDKSGIDPKSFDSHTNGFTIETATTNASFQGTVGKTYFAVVTSSIGSSESVPWTEKKLTITIQEPTIPTVTSLTSRIWMDRNLGASRVATNYDDEQAYGDLYQWGRGHDGHEKFDSPITTTISATNIPGHGMFIVNGDYPFEWRKLQNSSLWQGKDGTNNPCPAGFRLPTEQEWQIELDSWPAINSLGWPSGDILRLPLAGMRRSDTGQVIQKNQRATYWSSSSYYAGYARFIVVEIDVSTDSVRMSSDVAAAGASIRCIKD
ncbi:MAG: fibronectin type 3 domain-containing protein [Candidatus Electronema aureum]|uniref:Fibronectin type 3 domain-containing protein n=1 Tax=Candidatus Electronema aureum TaxID=2005002 RepID=A0A521FYC5_9BACT|nr:MAG: fibronectin type 3 domain-containing protein [Candidatus Electronema aureum]